MKRTSGFTLVELIVVITILAILGTIGFFSLSKYSLDTRDAKRISTLRSVVSGLNILQVKSWKYPSPDGLISTGSIWSIPLIYKGEIGSNITQLIGYSWNPVDPLGGTPYAYGISADWRYFQVAATVENFQTVSLDGWRFNQYVLDMLIPKVYADTPLKAKVEGNYMGHLKFLSGSQTWITNIPSLIFSDTGSVNLDPISSAAKFVINGESNLPYSLQGNIATTKTPTEIIQIIHHNSSASFTGIDITSITNNAAIDTAFTGATLASFWGNIEQIQSVVLWNSSSTSGGVSCSLSWVTIYHGQSITGYTSPSVPFGWTCSGSNRTCNNGTLGWDSAYVYASCNVANWADCSSGTWSGVTIAALTHWQSSVFTKTIAHGSWELTATCTNNSLTYTNLNTTCDANYIVDTTWSCILGTCSGTMPPNTEINWTQWTEAWTYSTTTGTCKFQCQAGYYWNGSSTCTPASIGYFVANAGAESQTTCTAWYYCGTSALIAPSGACTAWYYCPAGSTSATQTQCPANSYCPAWSGSPTGCPSGTTSPVWSTSAGACAAPRGEQSYTSPWTYTWTVPAGVTSVSVVCVGGGGSCSNGWASSFWSYVTWYGGSWRNWGSYSVSNPSKWGGGGGGTWWAPWSWYDGGWGGWAAGYLWNWGNGAFGQPWTAWKWGGGNGGPGWSDTCSPGWAGVWLCGINSSVLSTTTTPGSYGGTNSNSCSYGYFWGWQAGCGGWDVQGGGWGGLWWQNDIATTPWSTITVTIGAVWPSCGDGGGQWGACRIIWPGNSRQFPSTDVGP